MKIFNTVIPVALLVVAAGCQSDHTRTVSQSTITSPPTAQTPPPSQNAPPAIARQGPEPTSVQQVTTGNATYTIETIPTPRLTPTSREGDKATQVYSSNIIAVYVHTNNSVTVSSTNATLIPAPSNNPPPQNK